MEGALFATIAGGPWSEPGIDLVFRPFRPGLENALRQWCFGVSGTSRMAEPRVLFAMTLPQVTQKRLIGLKMTVLARQIRQGFDERVEAIGVTRAKWVLIAAVASSPDATQRELAAKLEVTDVTACRLIDRLVADGLIERREHPQDRRAYRVALTDAAQPLLAKLSAAAEAYEAGMFANLDDGDIDFLNGLLGRIAQNLSAAKDETLLPAEPPMHGA
jgi:MarR family transcriptional regulator, transcriptional regulator for hemolysin